jgi:hypothetical protein
MQASTFEIADKELLCQHCGNRYFFVKSAQLNTSFFEFINLEWLNQGGKLFVCSRCGFIHWFLPAVWATESIEVFEGEDSPVECLSCNSVLPAGTSKCPSCGWTYK